MSETFALSNWICLLFLCPSPSPSPLLYDVRLNGDSIVLAGLGSE